MQTLGVLAGDEQYELRDQIKTVGGGIKAWPDSGIEEKHVNAFARLTALIARAITAPAQERAVNQVMREAEQPVKDLLEAMTTLLRLYDKSSENEERIVIGMLESEIPFLDPTRDRLLKALAKIAQQNKQAEYRLIGQRQNRARKNLAAIEQSHRALLDQIPSN